jgi:DNA (cytosine-5)-methyltransferase 1
MARAGLGKEWSCLFSNDFDFKKARIYEKNWGKGILKAADVTSLVLGDLPDKANMVWASFPCQDLSLAGAGAGLKGERSGTFWPFWNLMKALIKEDRAPSIIALENVCGTITSHGGKDFTTICSAFQQEGYKFGAVVIDAALFVPQSRPRLFVIGVKEGCELPVALSGEPSERWHTRALRAAYERLPAKMKNNWVWWNFPEPAKRKNRFVDIIEDNPTSVEWRTAAETRELLAMMSDINLKKVEIAKRMGRRMVGTVYKRTRHDEDGDKVQRAEVRFDDVAGCLRTPAGGSSRQVIVVVDGRSVKSRLISTRETARLMGLPDDYDLPGNYNEAYHLTGDGVVVPVVRHLAAHVFEPVLAAQSATKTVPVQAALPLTGAVGSRVSEEIPENARS